MRPDVQSEEGSKQVMTKRGRNRKLFFFVLGAAVLFLCYSAFIAHLIYVRPDKIIDVKHWPRQCDR